MAARGTRLSDRADQIARHFISRYEAEWSNGGAEAVSRLYASDAVLVDLVTAIGRSQICALLRGIIGQGWTSIRFKIVNVRQVGGVILIANEYALEASITRRSARPGAFSGDSSWVYGEI